MTLKKGSISYYNKCEILMEMKEERYLIHLKEKVKGEYIEKKNE